MSYCSTADQTRREREFIEQFCQPLSVTVEYRHCSEDRECNIPEHIEIEDMWLGGRLLTGWLFDQLHESVCEKLLEEYQ